MELLRNHERRGSICSINFLQKNCWIRTSGHTYRLDTNGKRLISQWIRVKNKKYYLNEKGYRVTGDVLIKGKWYHFKNNGVYDPTAKVDAPNPQKPMVALTFDDGPGPYTDRLLDCLKCNNAKATFFMVGSSVPGRPESRIRFPGPALLSEMPPTKALPSAACPTVTVITAAGSYTPLVCLPSTGPSTPETGQTPEIRSTPSMRY